MKQYSGMKLFLIIILFGNLNLKSQSITYPIVETGVLDFYDNTSVITEPTAGQPFYGQDATYRGNTPSYTDNSDGTITDNVTGLMWQKEMGDTYSNAKRFNMNLSAMPAGMYLIKITVDGNSMMKKIIRR